jgi:hypothetical protein
MATLPLPRPCTLVERCGSISFAPTRLRRRLRRDRPWAESLQPWNVHCADKDGRSTSDLADSRTPDGIFAGAAGTRLAACFSWGSQAGQLLTDFNWRR